MLPSSKIEFQVDEQYENEKGVFTVISIHRNEMVIRWESGEEIRTDIELQRNIQARRQWEEMNRKAKAAKKKSGTGKQEGFFGFLPGDFKNTASGTNWRGRTQLGGAVATLLPQDRFSFNSWAFAQKPELHWQDTKHRRRAGANGARFFVRLTPMEMMYGFSIQCVQGGDGEAADWRNFSDWAARDESHRMLLTMADEHDLRIYDRSRPASGIFTFSEKGWRAEDGPKGQSLTLIELIESLSDNHNALFEVSQSVEKVDAVARGKEVAEDVSKLFSQLFPLYATSVASV
jgi:hypothetical protein